MSLWHRGNYLVRDTYKLTSVIISVIIILAQNTIPKPTHGVHFFETLLSPVVRVHLLGCIFDRHMAFSQVIDSRVSFTGHLISVGNSASRVALSIRPKSLGSFG